MTLLIPKQFAKNPLLPVGSVKKQQVTLEQPDINKELEDDVKRAIAITRLFYLHRELSMSKIYKLVGLQGNANKEMLCGVSRKKGKITLVGKDKSQRFYESLIQQITDTERHALDVWEKSGMFLTQNYEDQTFDMPIFQQVQVEVGDAYVYLLLIDNGYHKIGLTKNLNRRLKELKPNTVAPYDIHEVHHFPAVEAAKAERFLHDIFKEKRYKGEWFLLNDKDVAWFCSIKCYVDTIGLIDFDGRVLSPS